MESKTVQRPHQSSRVDAHLVMNVLNQMAAEDFHDRGVEDPALFALSSYLQEVFRQQASPRSTLADGARLLETYLHLYSLVHGSKIELSIAMNEKTANRPADRCLFQLANCLLTATRPKFGGRWRIHFALQAEGETARSLQILVDLQAMAGESQCIDMAAAQLSLENIEHAGHYRITAAVWTQTQPTDVRLQCTVLPLG